MARNGKFYCAGTNKGPQFSFNRNNQGTVPLENFLRYISFQEALKGQKLPCLFFETRPVTFKESNIDFLESDFDFLESDFDFLKSDFDFLKSDFDFQKSDFDL